VAASIKPFLEGVRRGTAGFLLQTMLLVEQRCEDPAERWRVLRSVLVKMARGELGDRGA
jgi:hypothetical protein